MGGPAAPARHPVRLVKGPGGVAAVDHEKKRCRRAGITHRSTDRFRSGPPSRGPTAFECQSIRSMFHHSRAPGARLVRLVVIDVAML
jgi:hypothetical protein